MKILFACSECSPFAASGGLADVAGSLPAALQKEGAECRVIMPLYGSIGLQWRANMTFLTSFGVPLSWRVAHCGVFTMQYGGVQYYFLDNEQYFKREGGIYGYFDEAANLETDATSKADDYYMIALLLFEQNAYSKARQYCQKALEVNPNYGNAYLLIGKMYAATSKSVFPNDGVLARAAYNAAIDKFEKAKQVDPSVAEEANTLISSYRAHLPSTEEIFMHPDLEKGKPFTVGGWIGERTTIR